MNIPIIPDKLYKLFLILGIGLVLYSFISFKDQFDLFKKRCTALNIEKINLDNQQKYIKEEFQEIYMKTDVISRKYLITNPFSKSYKSSNNFPRVFLFNQTDNIGSVLINKYIYQYNQKIKEINNIKKGLFINKYEFDENENSYKIAIYFFLIFGITGGILIIIGLVRWEIDENRFKKNDFRQNIDKPTCSIYCQSCGIYFNSMTRYATELNGTKNYHFCNKCYDNGEFIDINLTLDDLRKHRKNELRRKKKSLLYIHRTLNHLSTLDRWR